MLWNGLLVLKVPQSICERKNEKACYGKQLKIQEDIKIKMIKVGLVICHRGQLGKKKKKHETTVLISMNNTD